MSKKQRSKLKKTFEKARILSLATPNVRKQLICDGGRDAIDCVSECCLNILKGRVPLTSEQKTYLCKHKQQLRTVALKKVSLKKKKEIIQKGGFPLVAILAPAIAALGSLLLNRQ